MRTNTAPTLDGQLRVQTMRLLASPVGSSRAIAQKIEATGTWPAVVDLCARWQVVPALAMRLRALGLSLPSQQAADMRRHKIDRLVRSTRALQGGCGILRLLRDSGIPAVGFKGIAVFGWLHSGPGDRETHDADVLVRADDLPVVLRLLEAHGYRHKLAIGSLDDYLGFVRNSPGAAGNEALSLIDTDGAEIDLHWKLGRFDSEEVVASAQHVRILATEVPVVRPAFGLLLTVHHALRNNLVPDVLARDVLDCIGWFRLLVADSVELASAQEHARRHGLADGLAGMMIIVRRCGGDCPLPSAAESRAAAELADLYFVQLDEGAINMDLVYLVSGSSVARILRGLASGRKRYAELMRMFEAANGEQSLSFPDRARRLALSAGRATPAHWRRLRALARAKQGLLEGRPRL